MHFARWMNVPGNNMPLTFKPILIPFVISGLVSLYLGIYFLHANHRNKISILFFTMLMLAVVWVAANVLELMATDLDTQFMWKKVKYFGISFIFVIWLFLALEYTGARRMRCQEEKGGQKSETIPSHPSPLNQKP